MNDYFGYKHRKFVCVKARSIEWLEDQIEYEFAKEHIPNSININGSDLPIRIMSLRKHEVEIMTLEEWFNSNK